MKSENKGLPCTAPPVSQIPTAGFLRLPDVLRLIPISRSAWWTGVKSGKYPPSVKLAANTTAWKAEDIAALIQDLAKGAAK